MSGLILTILGLVSTGLIFPNYQGITPLADGISQQLWIEGQLMQDEAERNHQEEQKEIAINDYFVFADKIGKIIYARGCAGGYEKAVKGPDGKYHNCGTKSFDCGGAMKAYLVAKGLLTKESMSYFNSQTLYELGIKKDPRTAERGDFMYRKGFGKASTGNSSTHFAVVSRDYNPGDRTMWVYDNVVPNGTDRFHEREIPISCNSTMCHYAGMFRIYIATNGAYELAQQRGIDIQPREEVEKTDEVLMSVVPPHIYLTGATEIQTKVLDYMQVVTAGADDAMDFILTMYAEAKFNPKAISATKDGGLCQFHIPVHGDRRGDSIEKQVDDCRNKRKLVPVKGKYRFAYDHRNTYKDKFYTE